MKHLQQAAEPQRTDVGGIADLPRSPEILYDEYDADYERDDLLDLGGAEANAPIILKDMGFSLKQFAKRMGQPNFSAFNKWKKVWVAGWLKKNHWSIIRGQNRLKQLCDGPLHQETVVADVLRTFKTSMLLLNCDNAEWIRQWCIENFINICAREVEKLRKMGRRGNK
jgi:hypothetical protein